MLLSSVGRAASRLPSSLVFRLRSSDNTFLTRPPSVLKPTRMFSKAVKKHNASNSLKTTGTLSQQLFSSSPPTAVERARGVQGHSKEKENRPPRGSVTQYAYSNSGGALKRTASGLAKALEPERPFSNTVDNSQHNPIVIDDITPAVRTEQKTTTSFVDFDADDFDSDIDLDVENPASKGTGDVVYPTLPKVSMSAPLHPPVVYPTLPRAAPHSVHTGLDKGESEYISQLLPAQGTKLARASLTSPETKLPWSSSPLEHFQKPPKSLSVSQYKYESTEMSKDNTIPPDGSAQPSKKRRRLPWEVKAEPVQTPDSTEHSLYGAHHTPLPKSAKSEYPWNTTASAIKEQQKNFKQANKKLAKSNQADAAKNSLDTKKEKISRVFLSDEQRHVLNLVIERKKSVFFTGSAGTGKSVLLREIITGLRKKYIREPDRIAVTASTGLAACNVGGVTLHSFAGIGLGKESVPELAKKIKRNQKAKHRWMRTKVLIMDEISMVDGDLFDKLEELARILRNNGRPFGGIQLVITGDFFQLPPVPDYGRVAKFAFDAATWTTSIEHTIGLHHVFRQKDPEFARMLNEMREGQLQPDSIAKFRALSRELSFHDDIAATELFPTRAEVDAANNNRMRSLHGEIRTFEARDGGTMTDVTARTKLLANCMAPEAIQLKKGAQVMLIKNIDEQLVNGSLGKVVAFMDEVTFDRYVQEDNAPEGTMNSSPSIPDGYDAKGTTFRQELVASTAQLYPLVRFTLPDGNTRELLCQRESWKVELPNGEVQASRAQVPLILAWALSIHKAQGQTLDRVKVNLGRVFEKGQAYVALSRATSIPGLQVLNFDPKKVQAHERVRSFYAGLSRAENVGRKAAISRDKKLDGVELDDYEGMYAEDDYVDNDATAAYE